MKLLNKYWEERTESQCMGGIRLPIDIKETMGDKLHFTWLDNLIPKGTNLAPEPSNFWDKSIIQIRFSVTQTINSNIE